MNLRTHLEQIVEDRYKHQNNGMFRMASRILREWNLIEEIKDNEKETDYIIPCTWVMEGVFNVKAKTLEEAIQKVLNRSGDIPELPERCGRVDNSFSVCRVEAEEINVPIGSPVSEGPQRIFN